MNPFLTVSIKPIVVNSWQFTKSLIDSYPFVVENYYPKDGVKHWLCIIDGQEVIVKEFDYIVQIPFTDNDGNQKTTLISMSPSMYQKNFLEVDEAEFSNLNFNYV